ncbi:carboxylic ester hydrolase [Favolaschia claudopus]|uniref:Carboxylic ester hydrolase n=1 Tax=Favolaschia claudopus TaxID=2862362 RepID=A0AAW0AF39_9AGAR
MLSLFSLPFAVPLQLLKLSASATTPTVSLRYGTFEGFNSGNLTQFLGVPFAQAGRFEYPQEPDVLHGLQKATAYGPACPQQKVSHPPGLPFEVATYADISEDCLTLDVFKPARIEPDAKLPVFVWIYGGGFAIGHSRDFNLTPVVERSIEIGQPFIAVTINYRLNAFGWLMGKEAAAAGINNLGLRDQIFALEWVQRNIELFQGDPERVSVGGQSAGGVSTAFLTFDNAQDSNALFKGAWLQSGPPFHIPHLLDDQDIYDALLDATNCSSSSSPSSAMSRNATSIECLRTVPLETLISAVNAAPNFLNSDRCWGLRRRGNVRGVYYHLVNRVVFLIKGMYSNPRLFALASLNITTDAEFSGYVHSNYFPKTSSSELAELARLYPRDPAQGSPFGTGTEFQLSPQYKRVAAFTGDMLVTSPLRFFTQHASARQDVWGWSVTANKAAGGAAGAFHGIDTAAWMTRTTVLGTLGMDRMVNFVNNLNPNDPATPTAWPKHNSSSSSSLMVFADDGVSIAADDYRREAVNYLNYLRVKEA